METAVPSRGEKRPSELHASGLPGKVVIPSTEEQADCVVTNVSPAGAEIACEVAQLLDTPIVLYAAGLGRFEGHVVWERDGSYGIKFRSDREGEARPEEQGSRREGADTSGAERRRDKRTVSNTLAQYRRADGSIVPCLIVDFSISGLSLETNVRPQVGELIAIGGMIGRVVRFHETGVGVAFVEREPDDAAFAASLASLDLWHRQEGGRNGDREDS